MAEVRVGWGNLVTAEQLHNAAELLRAEDPAGTPEGHAQAEEIARFIRESRFWMRESSGAITGAVSFDSQSLGFGVVIGLLARRCAT